MSHGKRVREGDVECWMCNLTEKAAPSIEWNWLWCSADTLQELIALESWSEKLANHDFPNFLQTEFSNWITDNVGLLCKIYFPVFCFFFPPNKINNNWDWSWTFWMLEKFILYLFFFFFLVNSAKKIEVTDNLFVMSQKTLVSYVMDTSVNRGEHSQPGVPNMCKVYKSKSRCSSSSSSNEGHKHRSWLAVRVNKRLNIAPKVLQWSDRQSSWSHNMDCNVRTVHNMVIVELTFLKWLWFLCNITAQEDECWRCMQQSQGVQLVPQQSPCDDYFFFLFMLVT